MKMHIRLATVTNDAYGTDGTNGAALVTYQAVSTMALVEIGVPHGYLIPKSAVATLSGMPVMSVIL